MLAGIAALAKQAQAERPALGNVYKSVVSEQGNPVARQLMDKVFTPGDTVWRAMGTIPDSGLELRKSYQRFDALAHFNMEIGPDYDPPGCRCGEVIQGKVEPAECSLFGNQCTPAHPVGPCMVSSEGTCAAWYKYGRGQAAASGKVNAK
jgi:hydrogenase expression/formation protein HypD